MVLTKIIKCCPFLPRPTDVLPLVLTNRAVFRYGYGGGELDPAGGADEAPRSLCTLTDATIHGLSTFGEARHIGLL
jgi:hypothetical protein